MIECSECGETITKERNEMLWIPTGKVLHKDAFLGDGTKYNIYECQQCAFMRRWETSDSTKLTKSGREMCNWLFE